MQPEYELQVDLGERSYPVRIGPGLVGDAAQITPYLAGQQVLVVSNTKVAPLYLDAVCASLQGFTVETLVLPDGEAQKSLPSLARVFDALIAGGHHRTTTIVALGGGVIGDLAGFAAACYQRGVAFIQLPTTLLAQVDSSVGGKTAINHSAGKNLIGAFHQPRLVLADLAVLKTLPDKEYRAGLAELVKHAIIRDAELFAWLESHTTALAERHEAVLAEGLYRSVRIKAEIVAADEREAGVRAVLNFGHTFAHALETSAGYGHWLHGEAVAVGMSMALDLSVREQRIDEHLALRIRKVLAALGLPVALPKTSISAEQIRQMMNMDKKAADAGLRLIVLNDLGVAEQTMDFQEANLAQTLKSAIAGEMPA